MNVVSLLTGMISECATLRIKQSAYYFWKVCRFEFDVFRDPAGVIEFIGGTFGICRGRNHDNRLSIYICIG